MLIREMKLGDSASVTKTVTETDVYLFAGITGDLNPAHTNEVSASQTQFGGRIAHGILGAGFISASFTRRFKSFAISCFFWYILNPTVRINLCILSPSFT